MQIVHSQGQEKLEQSKTCSVCNKSTSLSGFYTKTYKGKTVYCSECKQCNSVRSKKLYTSERGFKIKLKRKYNISWEQYLEMYFKQNKKCFICQKVLQLAGQNASKSQTACIDHDHNTNQVRGILCVSCNTGLGNFRDNPDLLSTAIRYLKQSKV